MKAYEVTPELAALLKKPLGESAPADVERMKVLVQEELQRLLARAKK